MKIQLFHGTGHDGTSAPDQKHFGCAYFVLDCDHDPHAKAALKAYADSCRADYPKLAADLDRWHEEFDFGSPDSGGDGK